MAYLKYINEEYAQNLLGKRFPLGVKRTMKLLDQYLNFLNDAGDTLPSELLCHNISKSRDRSLSKFAKVDADMVIQLDDMSKKLCVDLRDYRIQTEFARDIHERRVVLHIIIKGSNKTTWAIHLPLQSLMVGFGDPMEGYHCYGHGISFFDKNGNPQDDEVFYCGITKRGWLKRMTEHFRDIKGGSDKTFHKQWREYQGDSNVLLNSELIALNHSYEAAMNWEEWIVNKCMDQNKSLNMIPGGFAGLKAVGKWSNISKSENRKSVVRGKTSFMCLGEESSRGMPNPFIEKLWLDDKYYAKVIGNRDNTFSREQVEKIRTMAKEGYDAKQIGKQLSIINIKRLKNILSNKTYVRM